MTGKKTRAVIATLVIAATTAGCELIVDFDRTKIDAGPGDATVADVTTDTQPPPVDAPADAPVDAGKDTGTMMDAKADVQADTGVDAGMDAGDDGAADATAD